MRRFLGGGPGADGPDCEGESPVGKGVLTVEQKVMFSISTDNSPDSVTCRQALVNAKGLQNPEGMGQGYVRVRVRVQNSEPSTNPYP